MSDKYSSTEKRIIQESCSHEATNFRNCIGAAYIAGNTLDHCHDNAKKFLDCAKNVQSRIRSKSTALAGDPIKTTSKISEQHALSDEYPIQASATGRSDEYPIHVSSSAENAGYRVANGTIHISDIYKYTPLEKQAIKQVCSDQMHGLERCFKEYNNNVVYQCSARIRDLNQCEIFALSRVRYDSSLFDKPLANIENIPKY